MALPRRSSRFLALLLSAALALPWAGPAYALRASSEPAQTGLEQALQPAVKHSGLEERGLDQPIADLGSATLGVRRSAVTTLLQYGADPEDRGLVASVFITGARLTVGVVDSRGQLVGDVASTNIAGEAERNTLETFIARVVRAVDARVQALGLSADRIRAVSVAATGDVDAATGVVRRSVNFPFLDGVNVRQQLAQRLRDAWKRPVMMLVHNDAVAEAVAEGLVGNAQGLDSYVYIHAGHTIGGSRVLRGRAENVEIGETIFPDPQRPNIPLSQLASGGALAEQAQRALGQLLAEHQESELVQRTSILTFVEPKAGSETASDRIARVTAQTVARAAQIGDPLATALLDGACGYLGRAIVRFAEETGERFFVIGGGLSLSGDVFYESVQRAVQRAGGRAVIDPSRITIARPRLAVEAGILGAATFVPTKTDEVVERMQQVLATTDPSTERLQAAESAITVLEGLVISAGGRSTTLRSKVVASLANVAVSNVPKPPRARALAALQAVGDGRAVEPLLTVFADDDPSLRAAAEAALTATVLRRLSQDDDQIAVGMDVGGTKIATAAVAGTGALVGTLAEVSTGAGESTEQIIERFVEQVLTVLARQRIPIEQLAAVSVIIPGELDSVRGIIHRINKIPSLNGVHVAERVEERLYARSGVRVPVFLHNDAEGAAMAEAVFGASQQLGLYRFCFVTISTGVGGAIVRGTRVENIEPGGTVFVKPSGRTQQGGRYHVADPAFAAALVQRLQIECQRWMAQHPGQALPPQYVVHAEGRDTPSAGEEAVASLTVADIVQAANRGHPDAQERIERGVRVSDIASGTSMAFRVQHEIGAFQRRYPGRPLPPRFRRLLVYSEGTRETERVRNLTAKAIGLAANNGVPYAQAVIEDAARYLGQALVQIATTRHQRTFILAGGVTLVGEFFTTAVKKVLSQQIPNTRVFSTQVGGVVLSRFGNERGILGAYAFVPTRVERLLGPLVRAMMAPQAVVRETAMEAWLTVMAHAASWTLNEREAAELESLRAQTLANALGRLSDAQELSGVKIQAARVLGALGDETAVDQLLAAASSAETEVQPAIRDTLVAIVARAHHDESVTIGIDFGRGSITTGVVNAQRQLISPLEQVPTDADAAVPVLLGQVVDEAFETLSKSKTPLSRAKAVSLGMTGDIQNGRVVRSRFLPKLDGVDVQATLATMIADRIGRPIPVYVRNDMVNAAVGESQYGVGAGDETNVVVSVGRELRGVVVRSGRAEPLPLAARLLRAPRGRAGDLASGEAIARRARRAIRVWIRTHSGADPEASLGILKVMRWRAPPGIPLQEVIRRIAAREVQTAAAQGDDMARHIVETAGHALAVALAEISQENGQRRFIVIGGVAQQTEGVLLTSLRRALRVESHQRSLDPPLQLLEPRLGGQAAILGAAMAVPTKRARIQSLLETFNATTPAQQALVAQALEALPATGLEEVAVESKATREVVGSQL